MAVLNTTSPTLWPSAPMASPRKMLPSARARMAGVDKKTSERLTRFCRKRAAQKRERCDFHFTPLQRHCQIRAEIDRLARHFTGLTNKYPHRLSPYIHTTRRSAVLFHNPGGRVKTASGSRNLCRRTSTPLLAGRLDTRFNNKNRDFNHENLSEVCIVPAVPRTCCPGPGRCTAGSESSRAAQ